MVPFGENTRQYIFVNKHLRDVGLDRQNVKADHQSNRHRPKRRKGEYHEQNSTDDTLDEQKGFLIIRSHKESDMLQGLADNLTCAAQKSRR